MRGKNWAVFCTQANRENLAISQLMNQGFDVCMPMQAKTVRHARKTITLKRPFFPGYGFVSIGKDTRWLSVNGTRGVKYLICRAGKPALLPDGFIEALQKQLDPETGIDLANSLKKGDKVKIATGPLAGLVGELAKTHSNGRATILVSLLLDCVPVKTLARNLTFA